MLAACSFFLALTTCKLVSFRFQFDVAVSSAFSLLHRRSVLSSCCVAAKMAAELSVYVSGPLQLTTYRQAYQNGKRALAC